MVVPMPVPASRACDALPGQQGLPGEERGERRRHPGYRGDGAEDRCLGGQDAAEFPDASVQ
jgi:hypothetical protein